jgi:hypothetical protein
LHDVFERRLNTHDDTKKREGGGGESRKKHAWRCVV